MFKEKPKERFEDKVEVTSQFIEDFKYLIKLVEIMDKRNHIENINKIEKLKSIKDYEIINSLDIIRLLCKNREKINEIIEFIEGENNK